jgi:hypothetical protein
MQSAGASGSDHLTDPFSVRRKAMLINIATAAGSHSAETIGAAWGDHYEDLQGARGIFVVDDPKHELILPGDRDFGATGFLRWEFRYSAPIFCDTNFVSYCGVFFAGRHLKANEEGFREAVTLSAANKAKHQRNGLCAGERR